MTSIRRALEAAAGVSTGEADPEATDFDGQTNYLERTTAFSNLSDSKTFTVSFWIYPSPMYATATDAGANGTIFWDGSASTTQRSAMKYHSRDDGTSKVTTYFRRSAGTDALQLIIQVPLATWTNVLFSVDLANASNRYVYLNDVDVSTNTDIVDWDTYVDDEVEWAQDYHRIGKLHSDQQWFQGRLAHFFLDNTYRDLSSSVNRRHFIDADGFPADPSSLSPPIYFPMTDATTVESNSGTGGDMTSYGTFAQSARGPNQINNIASNIGKLGKALDATWDATNTAVVTGAFICSADKQTYTQFLHQPSGGYWEIGFQSATTFRVYFQGSSTARASITIPLSNMATYHVAFSVDTSSEANSTLWINGVNVTATATATNFVGGTINFSGWPKFELSAAWGTHDTLMGEVWFEKVYRDLASDNIFWDSDNNRPFTVAQVMENTGYTPLMALPVYAPDPGQNDGSEIDIPSVTGLPWEGALSMSEYQGRTINNSAGSVNVPIMRYSSALSGVSDGKTWSMAFSFWPEEASSKTIIAIGPNDYQRVWVKASPSGILVYTKNSSNTLIGSLAVESLSLGEDTWHNVLICMHQASSANCHIYIDGVDRTIVENTLTDDNVNFSTTGGCSFGGFIESSTTDGNNFVGNYGNIFWTTEYIDFSVEANRRKFYSPLQLPVDCGSDGTTPTGTAPAIYMRNDINAYGTNAGTGGDFTTPGSGDVKEGILIGHVPLEST